MNDPERLRSWIKNIPRDIVPTKQIVVCERHFCDEFIIGYDSVSRPDGSILTVKPDIPKLTSDAYPHIFITQENTAATVDVPYHLTEQSPSNVAKIKCPSVREKSNNVSIK